MKHFKYSQRFKKLYTHKPTLVILIIASSLFLVVYSVGAAYISSHPPTNKPSSGLIQPKDNTQAKGTDSAKSNNQSTSTTQTNSGTSPTTETKTTTSSKTNHPYVASVCTRTVIPYTTRYVNDPALAVGVSIPSGGVDGVVSTCTLDSEGWKNTLGEYNYPAVEKVIRVGTKQPDPVVRSNHDLCVVGYLATYPTATTTVAHQWCYAHGDPY